MLTSRLVPAVAYHLEYVHDGDIKRACVLNEIGASEESVFLSIESHETNRGGTLNAGGQPGTLEESCYAARIVVRPRSSGNAVVVGADQNNSVRFEVRRQGHDVFVESLEMSQVSEALEFVSDPLCAVSVA
jgi:hypothetical protein